MLLEKVISTIQTTSQKKSYSEDQSHNEFQPFQCTPVLGKLWGWFRGLFAIFLLSHQQYSSLRCERHCCRRWNHSQFTLPFYFLEVTSNEEETGIFPDHGSVVH